MTAECRAVTAECRAVIATRQSHRTSSWRVIQLEAPEAGFEGHWTAICVIASLSVGAVSYINSPLLRVSSAILTSTNTQVARLVFRRSESRPGSPLRRQEGLQRRQQPRPRNWSGASLPAPAPTRHRVPTCVGRRSFAYISCTETLRPAVSWH